MQDLTGKITGSNLSAAEWNQLPQEVQNVITAWEALAGPGDLNQLGKGIAAYAAASHFYTGSGPADAYVCTVLPGIQAPPAYDDGMMIRFRPSVVNTGASTVTVAGLGIKDIKKENGSALIAGELDTDRDAWCRYDGTDFLLANWAANATPATPVTPPGHRSGLITSRVDDDTFGISAGRCRNLADDTTLILASAFTKNIDASGWVAGTGNNGRPTGVSLTANTPLHMFAIRKIAGGLVDVGIDTSLIAANLLSDSGYDHFRRVGTFRLDATSDIIDYIQIGNYFARVSDLDGITVISGTSTLTPLQLFCPDDIRTKVSLRITFDNNATSRYGIVVPGDFPAQTASATLFNFASQSDSTSFDSSNLETWTSPSGDIDANQTGSNADVRTDGYWDDLGDSGAELTV